MKRRYLLTSLLAISMIFTGCSGEDIPETVSSTEVSSESETETHEHDHSSEEETTTLDESSIMEDILNNAANLDSELLDNYDVTIKINNENIGESDIVSVIAIDRIDDDIIIVSYTDASGEMKAVEFGSYEEFENSVEIIEIKEKETAPETVPEETEVPEGTEDTEEAEGTEDSGSTEGTSEEDDSTEKEFQFSSA